MCVCMCVCVCVCVSVSVCLCVCVCARWLKTPATDSYLNNTSSTNSLTWKGLMNKRQSSALLLPCPVTAVGVFYSGGFTV